MNTIASITDAVEADIAFSSAIAVSIDGSFDATLIVELSLDQPTPLWIRTELSVPQHGRAVRHIKAPGIFFAVTAGTQKLRVRAVVFTSGIAEITVRQINTASAKPPRDLIDD